MASQFKTPNDMSIQCPGSDTSVSEPNFQDRIERNYLIGLVESSTGMLWRQLGEYLTGYGFHPIYNITCVGSVYFDNRDFDLTRFTILNGGRHILVRLRAYESYGEAPKPILHYWVEVKIREKERWRKKRFRLDRRDLAGLLTGGDPGRSLFESNAVSSVAVRQLYRETQETILTNGLRPILLLTYRRLAFQNDTERVCLDSDIRYYHVDEDVYTYDSWKYPIQEPAGKSRKVILELKYPDGALPVWLESLEQRYPITLTNFSKYVEGMGVLFQGPLRSHREATYFLPRIETYMLNSERL
ncbi:MAG TPA: VTC domain-containing protein [Candidatus Eisenbacteria bacterium]|nr:VTC domain-containing protein [Candidatus Eisenbacteria bacterium]